MYYIISYISFTSSKSWKLRFEMITWEVCPKIAFVKCETDKEGSYSLITFPNFCWTMTHKRASRILPVVNVSQWRWLHSTSQSWLAVCSLAFHKSGSCLRRLERKKKCRNEHRSVVPKCWGAFFFENTPWHWLTFAAAFMLHFSFIICRERTASNAWKRKVPAASTGETWEFPAGVEKDKCYPSRWLNSS